MAWYVRFNITDEFGESLEHGTFPSYDKAKDFLEKFGYREKYRPYFEHQRDQSLVAQVGELKPARKFPPKWFKSRGLVD